MDKADIGKLFKLARIEINSQELEKFPKELEAILEYVAILKKAPLGAVTPTLSMAPNANVLRPDTAPSADPEITKILRKAFPRSDGDYVKTKKVFGD